MALDDEEDSSYPSDGESNESQPGVTDTDDGGAIVQMDKPADDEPTADEEDFYRNLAEEIPESELSKLCLELVERIDHDKDSRKDRDEKYAEGIKRTGFGDEAPGGAAFVGASTAVHPMLSKATIYYQSHTINELFPPEGPVRDLIPGTITPDREAKAERKARHMNWQFRVQMPEARSQMERMLSQQPLAGSQYPRMVYDSRKKRPVLTYIPLDDVYIPEAAGDFYSAERRTFVDRITQHEFESRIRAKYYCAISLTPPSQIPEESRAGQATDRVQGKKSEVKNEDGLRLIYVTEALAVIENTKDLRIAGELRGSDTDTVLEDGDPLPYLIEIDVLNHRIVRCVRNWEPKDPLRENMNWMVDFEFLPWRGAQSVGLIHAIGSLAGAGSGALRALLDCAHVQNLPTLLKLKGVNSPGQTLDLNVCQVTEIEANALGDGDIRKVVMAIPFNPPSTMLYQLLGWCTDQGEAVIRTTFENLSDDGSPNMPVGTTLALIEQGMKVLSAIHMRLHHAMDRLIGILHRINRLYVTDEEILDDTGEMLAYRADYEGPIDVLPVSDPQVFSDVQRFAQLQIVAQRAQTMPQLYNLRKVEELILKRTKIPNAVDLLVPEPKVDELNAVNENVAMTLGRPVMAFPEQDHLAHIQVLLDYITSPFFGMLSIVAPKYLPAALQHLVEHLAYWYLSHTVEIASQAAGSDIGEMTQFQDTETKLEMDKTLAAASSRVMKQATSTLSKIPQAVQQAQQLLQSLMPPPPQDPSQSAKEVAQINAQSKQASSQQASKDKQASEQAKAQSDLQKTTVQEDNQNQRTAAEIASHEQINREDNATALEISAAKIETGHSTDLSTGTGIGGHEGPLNPGGTGG